MAALIWLQLQVRGYSDAKEMRVHAPTRVVSQIGVGLCDK